MLSSSRALWEKEKNHTGEEQEARGKAGLFNSQDFRVIQSPGYCPQQISRKYCWPETEIITVFRKRPNRWVSCVKRHLRKANKFVKVIPGEESM